VAFNDLDAVRDVCSREGERIACIIVEPVVGNMGCVPPLPGFHEGLRKVCDQYGIVLVFDEVMTGFRVAYGGAQQLYRIKPDLTTLGKVIGGGLPVGAYGGKREIMEKIAPLGPIYQAGTLSGNPLAMAAGIATLDALPVGGAWQKAEAAAAGAAQALADAARAAGAPLVVQRVGTMFTPFFTDQPVTDFATARAADRARYAAFHERALEAGVYLPPSPFEAAFTSTAHGEAEIERLAAAATQSFGRMAP